jgi:hypothetical protein
MNLLIQDALSTSAGATMYGSGLENNKNHKIPVIGR